MLNLTHNLFEIQILYGVEVSPDFKSGDKSSLTAAFFVYLPV